MNSFYYRSKVWIFTAVLTLFPIHVLLIKIKNFLYDYNFWKAKKSKAKVISVGNLSLGGSGKTPTPPSQLRKLARAACEKNALRNHGLWRGMVSPGNRIFQSLD